MSRYWVCRNQRVIIREDQMLSVILERPVRCHVGRVTSRETTYLTALDCHRKPHFRCFSYLLGTKNQTGVKPWVSICCFAAFLRKAKVESSQVEKMERWTRPERPGRSSNHDGLRWRKMVEYLRADFQASSAMRTGTCSSRQSVHKIDGSLSSKDVGLSASLHFLSCFLVQNSVLCRFICTTMTRKKRFKLQLRSSKTRTIYQMEKLDQDSQIHS